MPESFETRLSSLSKKTELLLERYRLIAEQRDEAYRQIRDLNGQLDKARKQIRELSTEVEYLKVVNSMEPAAGDTEKTRALLSELVWEIDKCISQLND